MSIWSLALRATLALAASAAAMVPVTDAQSRRGTAGEGHYGHVTAESMFGPQTITAPVRRGSHGRLEVRLPGGTWIECVRGCRDTLRRETVDFWNIRDGRGAPGDPVGYLRFRF